MPRVSICLPTRDRYGLLSKAANSVLLQTLEDWELVILDNSLDRHDPGFLDPRIRWISEDADGMIDAVNRAQAHARGDLVCFLADDDLMTPWALATMIAPFEDEAVKWAYGQTDFRVDGERKFLLGLPWDHPMLLRQHYLGCAVIYERDFVTKLGGHDPAYGLAADYDLRLRAANLETPAFVEAVCYVANQTSDSASRKDPEGTIRDATRAMRRYRVIDGKVEEVPNGGAQTFALVMIVKDEEKTIGRCIDAALKLPGLHHWTICDTGSTDRTCEIVEEKLGHLPGTLYRDEWRDYGHNRTLSIQRARGTADYLLCLDADDELQIVHELPFLTDQWYGITYTGNLHNPLPRLVKGDLPWRYVGYTHEYLDCGEPSLISFQDALVIRHHEDGANRPGKFARDRELLERAIADNPDDHRAVFYLANTLRGAGEIEEACRLYRKRAGMGGFEEEEFYSLFQEGLMRQSREILLEAWLKRKTRAEPLFALAAMALQRGEPQEAIVWAESCLGMPFPIGDVVAVDRAPYNGAAHEILRDAYLMIAERHTESVRDETYAPTTKPDLALKGT